MEHRQSGNPLAPGRQKSGNQVRQVTGAQTLSMNLRHAPEEKWGSGALEGKATVEGRGGSLGKLANSMHIHPRE